MQRTAHFPLVRPSGFRLKESQWASEAIHLIRNEAHIEASTDAWPKTIKFDDFSVHTPFEITITAPVALDPTGGVKRLGRWSKIEPTLPDRQTMVVTPTTDFGDGKGPRDFRLISAPYDPGSNDNTLVFDTDGSFGFAAGHNTASQGHAAKEARNGETDGGNSTGDGFSSYALLDALTRYLEGSQSLGVGSSL